MTLRPLVAAALVILSTACGVTAEQEANPVADSEVPFDLLRRQPASPSTTAPVHDTVDVEVYFVGSSGLTPVVRPIATSVPLPALLALLGDGPTSAERQAGLGTAVPASDGILQVAVRGEVATVELGPAFVALAPEEQRTALAQVVYTLTAQPKVVRVAFTVDGNPAEVPRGDGSLTAGSVTREDYPPTPPTP
jgi:spore germination protein GerM